MVEMICFAIEPLLYLSFHKCFSHAILPNLVHKTKHVYVLSKLSRCMSIIAGFDLWMSKGTYDIFASVITFLHENW